MRNLTLVFVCVHMRVMIFFLFCHNCRCVYVNRYCMCEPVLNSELNLNSPFLSCNKTNCKDVAAIENISPFSEADPILDILVQRLNLV